MLTSHFAYKKYSIELFQNEVKPQGSLHTESEFFVRNVCTLKNKYDLMLCQSGLHTVFNFSPS